MIFDEDKAAVDALRARAKRHGMQFRKSRERMRHSNNRGGLMLVDGYTGNPLDGSNFGLDVEGARYSLDREIARRAV